MASVLDRLDEAYTKFLAFTKASAHHIGITEEEYRIRAAKQPKDVIVALPSIQTALDKHAKEIHKYAAAREAGEERPDLAYFLVLAPKNTVFDHTQIPTEVIDKAFQFARVFESLLRDLDKEDE